MFVDRARIYVKGGDGGNGCIAFRREKYVPRGGPSGGDGGRGGDVILVVDEGLRTLMDFKYRVHFKAGKGSHGQGSNMSGRDGENLVIRVPPGTLVRDSGTGEVLGDLTEHGQQLVVARGGKGGRGNARFATPTRQAPRFSEKGEPGEERWVELELKLLADVGLIGFPNAGKSTLLSRVSSARPKIADYPFTTLTPNLGVVSVEGAGDFVMADIPGLIEGAHEGKGLGLEFLRHIERTKVLVHVVDAAGTEGRDPISDFIIVNKEIAQYSESLKALPQIVALNKMDLPQARANEPRLRRTIEEMGLEVYGVSAVSGEGIEQLLYAVIDALRREEARRKSAAAERTAGGQSVETGYSDG